jgi:hypothetical protein
VQGLLGDSPILLAGCYRKGGIEKSNVGDGQSRCSAAVAARSEVVECHLVVGPNRSTCGSLEMNIGCYDMIEGRERLSNVLLAFDQDGCMKTTKVHHCLHISLLRSTDSRNRAVVIRCTSALIARSTCTCKWSVSRWYPQATATMRITELSATVDHLALSLVQVRSSDRTAISRIFAGGKPNA